MRALSLTQPWASLVALGEKRIETRSWPTSYRGPLAIHAAKGFPKPCRDLCAQEPFASALRHSGVGGLGLLTPAKALPLGAILAVVTVVDCLPTVNAELAFQAVEQLDPPEEGDVRRVERERAFGDYSPGRYAWVLEDARALREPVEARGALGLWNLPATVQALVDVETSILTPDQARQELRL
jgi:activating signal cointegrator 1